MVGKTNCWGSSCDEQWRQLDDKVSITLHMCTTLVEPVSLVQETIYMETFVDISTKIQETLLDKAKELNYPFNLSTTKTYF